MRMAWCRAALSAFVRRWAAYLLTGFGVLVIGMSGGVGATLGTVQSLCAWTVLPLFHAVAEPAWIVPATVVQAAAGGLLVWGMRPLLWPARWGAAERALPLARRELLVSDCRVVPMGLLPFFVVCAVGARALIADPPAWLLPLRAGAALTVALVGSVVIGVGMLQWLRRRPVSPARRAIVGSMVMNGVAPLGSGASPVAAFGWWRALLVWPLWRGPARRSGIALAVGTALACMPAAALVRWPAAAAWCIAAHASLSLVAVTRAHGLLRLELAPLLHACSPLPIPARSVRCVRDAMALVPLTVSAVPLALACLAQPGLRPAVLAGYLLVCVAGAVFEVRAVPREAADKAGRWVFSLVVMIAFASEVMG